MAELRAGGHRVRLDDRTETSFGRRSVDWELKGVPVRVEIGPRDLAEGRVTVVTRHLRHKENLDLAGRRRRGRRHPGPGRARALGRGHQGPPGPHGGRRHPRRGRRGGGHRLRPDPGRRRWAPTARTAWPPTRLSIRCLQRPDGGLAEPTTTGRTGDGPDRGGGPVLLTGPGLTRRLGPAAGPAQRRTARRGRIAVIACALSSLCIVLGGAWAAATLSLCRAPSCSCAQQQKVKDDHRTHREEEEGSTGSADDLLARCAALLDPRRLDLVDVEEHRCR